MSKPHQASYEVEVRGKTPGKFATLLTKFHKIATFVGEKDRFSLIYFNHGLVKDVREIKDEKIDLRLRITNKQAELVLKYGAWGGSDSREEHSLPIPNEKFAETVLILQRLGWTNGVAFATKTYVFKYKNIEFALVQNKYINYFEAERMITNKENIDKERAIILAICRSLGLEPFSDEAFMDSLNIINNNPENQFDFRKQSFDEVRKQYKEFF
ncbi:MAG: CYTH domain-containing protein [Candidatus Woesearchaeota archaeon]|nr:CYTH domain-containing protein [Candidatus Woesearchaeota archaeon]